MAEIDIDLVPEIKEALKAIKQFGKVADKVLADVEKDAKDVLEPIKKQERGIKNTLKVIALGFKKTFSGAGKAVSKFTSGFRGGLKSITDALFSVQGLVLGIGAVLAGGALTSFLKDATDAAAAEEVAVNNLNQALKRNGQFTKETSQDLQDFASQLQKTTTFGNETVLEMLALSQAFGANAEQAKIATKAATELSVAAGISVEEATRRVGRAMSGSIEDISKFASGIRDLTKDELAAGKAAEELVKALGGTAAAQVKTFAGAISQAKNSFGDFLEEVGFAITKNPVVIAIINEFSEAMGKLGGFFKENRDEISSFITNGLLALVSQIPKVIKAIGSVGKAFGAILIGVDTAKLAFIDLILTASKFEVINFIVRKVANQFLILNKFISLVLGRDAPTLVESFTQLDESINETTESLKKTREEALNSSDGVFEFLTTLDKGIEEVNKTVNKSIDGLKKVADEGSKTGEILDEAIDKERLAKTSLETIVSIIPTSKEDLSLLISDIETALSSISISDKAIVSALSGVAKTGAQGIAEKAVVAFSAKLLPGLGGVGGEMFQLLSQDAEQFAESLNKLFSVDFIQNIADNIPVLIDAIIERLPDIIEELIKVIIAEAPEISSAMAKAMFDPNFILALAEAYKTGIARGTKNVIADLKKEMTKFFGEGFVNGIKVTIADTRKEMEKFFSDGFINGIRKGLIEIKDELENIFKIKLPSGGVGGFASKVTGGLKFAKGGQVPSGFPNDTFPARLTSDELVIPPGDTKRLSNFLDSFENRREQTQTMNLPVPINQNQDRELVINLVVGEEQLATTLVNLNEQGFRTA